jgi:hypothetical protein
MKLENQIFFFSLQNNNTMKKKMSSYVFLVGRNGDHFCFEIDHKQSSLLLKKIIISQTIPYSGLLVGSKGVHNFKIRPRYKFYFDFDNN